MLIANIALQTMSGALSDEGVLTSWWGRLFRWQDVTYYGVLTAIMIFPRPVIHIAGYVIMLLGYTMIIVLNPALT